MDTFSARALSARIGQLHCMGGVGCGGVGGGVESGLPSSVCPLPLVPCHGLPSVATRGWSVLSLDHCSACVAVAFRLVSCSFGRFVLLGDMCRPGCLVCGEWSEGCRPQSFRRVASGVYLYSDVVPMAAILVDIL